ncbi:MAG TPA: hypothetical protein VJ375_16415 [Gaiellaceae bacterium]|nr:hypothetical protein [Gaiellaceae bacterium]
MFSPNWRLWKVRSGLVLLATPAREDGGVPPIGAKTLLLFGMDDECTGSVLE